jgi:hypothetical protein
MGGFKTAFVKKVATIGGGRIGGHHGYKKLTSPTREEEDDHLLQHNTLIKIAIVHIR